MKLRSLLSWSEQGRHEYFRRSTTSYKAYKQGPVACTIRTWKSRNNARKDEESFSYSDKQVTRGRKKVLAALSQ